VGSREKWLYFSYTRGTAAGGIRIIKTMGSKIIALKPIHGFAAETSAAFTILSASHMGLPVSTTHVIPGAIMGVGASQRVSAVRWGVTTRIMWARVLTILICAFVAGVTYGITSALLGPCCGAPLDHASVSSADQPR
jgi:inorganic phosphate transporter, PiT family